MDEKYYFISFEMMPRQSALAQPGAPVGIVKSGIAIDIHPFDFMADRIAEGFNINLLFWREITKDEHDAFFDKVIKKKKGDDPFGKTN